MARATVAEVRLALREVLDDRLVVGVIQKRLVLLLSCYGAGAVLQVQNRQVPTPLRRDLLELDVPDAGEAVVPDAYKLLAALGQLVLPDEEALLALEVPPRAVQTHVLLDVSPRRQVYDVE